MAHSIVGSGVKDTMMEVVLKSLVGQKGLIIFNLLFLFNSPFFKNSLMATGLERVCVCVCVCVSVIIVNRQELPILLREVF